MVSVLQEISEAVISGNSKEKVKELTRRAVAEGYPVKEVMDNGLIMGMNGIGEMWIRGEAFIPEVLLSAEVMRCGIDVIRDLIVKSGIKPIGKVVIGTVKGDVHGIGKSLVSMLLQSAGFELHDLGVNVSPEKFVEAIRTHEPDLAGMSALLTTTMPEMLHTIQAIKKAGLKTITIIGGAPTSQEYADTIGADGYAPDAVSAVAKARELVEASTRGGGTMQQ